MSEEVLDVSNNESAEQNEQPDGLGWSDDAPEEVASNNVAKEVEGQVQETEPEYPEWFMKDKHKTIEDQARSAFELQKKMGKHWGPPEEYKFEGIDGISEDDPIMKRFAPALKEMGISQEGLKYLVNQYMDANLNYVKEMEQNLHKELTGKDKMTFEAVDKWMVNTFSPDDRKTIQSWISTPDDFRIINTLRTMMPKSNNVPSPLDYNIPTYESSKDITNEKIKYRKEVAQGLRVSDKGFENELQQRWRDARTRELASEKTSRR